MLMELTGFSNHITGQHCWWDKTNNYFLWDRSRIYGCPPQNTGAPVVRCLCFSWCWFRGWPGKADCFSQSQLSKGKLCLSQQGLSQGKVGKSGRYSGKALPLPFDNHSLKKMWKPWGTLSGYKLHSGSPRWRIHDNSSWNVFFIHSGPVVYHFFQRKSLLPRL